MKALTRFVFCLSALVFILAACAPAAINTPAAATAPTAPPAASPTAAPAVVPQPSQTPARVSSPTPAENIYSDVSAGFSLAYPAGWTIEANKPIGTRASQALLLSPGTTAETLAQGGTRVAIVLYAWDPKNDLAAYLAHRKGAWDASGSKIIEEMQLNLAGGRQAAGFTLQGTDGQQVFLLVTAAGDSYLEVTGVGDLAAARKIALSLAPLNQ